MQFYGLPGMVSHFKDKSLKTTHPWRKSESLIRKFRMSWLNPFSLLAPTVLTLKSIGCHFSPIFKPNKYMTKNEQANMKTRLVYTGGILATGWLESKATKCTSTCIPFGKGDSAGGNAIVQSRLFWVLWVQAPMCHAHKHVENMISEAAGNMHYWQFSTCLSTGDFMCDASWPNLHSCPNLSIFLLFSSLVLTNNWIGWSCFHMALSRHLKK